MKRSWKSVLTVLIALVFSFQFFLVPPSVKAEDGESSFSFTLLHVNDSHARVEQFPKLATALQEIRNTVHARGGHTLLLHAGDVFSGTLYFTVHEGQADLYLMNYLGFDAMAFGNHEFDKGSGPLSKFIQGAKFPFLATNIDFSRDGRLKDFVADIGEEAVILPYLVKDIDGEKVGIIGLTTEDTPQISSPGEDIRFLDAFKAAEETVELLTREGINKIIVLSHLGFDVDRLLAEKVRGIDVIVGGHTHTVLPEGYLVSGEEPTVIVQAGEYLQYLGQLDVQFDKNGVIRDFDASLISLENYVADGQLLAKVEEFKGPIDELLKEEVGEAKVFLDGERANVRTKETNLGNLIADGMAWKVSQFVPGTRIALQNGGGIRASIQPGKITMGDVRTVLPFENVLVAIELTGQELLEALEHSVSAYPAQSGGFLQVSGIKFTFDPNGEPYHRVTEVLVSDENGNYVPLDLKKTYSVATNSFTAKGGDGYESLKRAYEDGRMINLDIPDYEVFSEYIQFLSGPVDARIEGRINTKQAPDEEPGQGETPDHPGSKPSDQNPPAKDGGSDGGSKVPVSGSESPSADTGATGNKLPNTAAGHLQWMFTGLLLILFSAAVYFLPKKRMESRK